MKSGKNELPTEKHIHFEIWLKIEEEDEVMQGSTP